MRAKKPDSWSIINFLICGGGILCFALFAIYPNQMALSKMDREVRELTARIEEQKLLFPLFKELLKFSREKDTDTLPFPEKAKLKQNEIGKISTIIKEFAKENNLSVEEITPDINSLVDDSSHLKMYLKLKGDFPNLRNFFLRTGELPYLDHIEQIQIRTVSESDDLELGLKVWLAKE